MFVCGYRHILTSLTLVLDLIPYTVGLPRCPKGWTGFGCNHQCFCAENECDEDSETCRNGDICKKDFFGTACQYTNVVSMSNGTTGDLFDQDDSTCSSEENGQISLQFDRELRFTFMRLVLQNIANLNKVEISFMHKDSSVSQCQNYTYLYDSPSTLDIHCLVDRLYTVMTITWSGDVSLCDVYISGGRKLYVPAVNSTSVFKDRNQISKMIDGFAVSCFFPESSEVHAYWNLLYNDHMVFQRISILGCTECLVTMGGRDYTTIDASYTALDYFEWSVKNEIVPPIVRVTFLSNNPEIKLCEIVSYGDCQPGYHGFDCSKNCAGHCPRGSCHLFDNKCTSCQPHTYGSECEKDCTNCRVLGLCDNTDGTCYTSDQSMYTTEETNDDSFIVGATDEQHRNATDETLDDDRNIEADKSSTGSDGWIKIWFVFIILFFILVIGIILSLLYKYMTKSNLQSTISD